MEAPLTVIAVGRDFERLEREELASLGKKIVGCGNGKVFYLDSDEMARNDNSEMPFFY